MLKSMLLISALVASASARASNDCTPFVGEDGKEWSHCTIVTHPEFKPLDELDKNCSLKEEEDLISHNIINETKIILASSIKNLDTLQVVNELNHFPTAASAKNVMEYYGIPYRAAMSILEVNRDLHVTDAKINLASGDYHDLRVIPLSPCLDALIKRLRPEPLRKLPQGEMLTTPDMKHSQELNAPEVGH